MEKNKLLGDLSQFFHYVQDNWIDPDFVIDITEVFDGKMAAISAFGSQFFNPESDEPANSDFIT